MTYTVWTFAKENTLNALWVAHEVETQQAAEAIAGNVKNIYGDNTVWVEEDD